MSEQTTALGATQEAPLFNAPKKKNKWVKRVIAIVAVVAVLAAIFALFLSGGKEAVAGSYLPETAQIRDIAVTVTGPGTIQPNDTYRATTLIKGEVLTAPFEEGDLIKADDVLFTLDAGNVEDSIRQAEIGVEQARAAAQQAQLSVRSAQLNYDSLVDARDDNAVDRQVKANATGVVTKVYVDPGDTVAAGTPIADILDRDSMKLTLPFHAANADTFFVGQQATVVVSGTAETLYGVIDEIAAVNSVGAGGTLVRDVTIVVSNPGALSNASSGTAAVNGVTSAGTANFRFNASAQLIALYTGELEELNIVEGSAVTDGQIVGSFKEEQFQDQIDAAQISLENAQIAAQNAQLSLQKAEDSLETIRESLEDYVITSPIDGRVIEMNYKAGDNVDPSTASATGANPFLAVVYDMSRLTFDINVDELDVVKLKAGQKVAFTADALEEQTFTGVVEKVNINGTTINGSTSYPVTVAVDGDGEELQNMGLYPGMNVSANIIVEEVGSVLTVPVDAVNRNGTVLVAGSGALNEEGALTDPTKLESRAVELGRNNDEYVEILSGLEEGETVYILNTASNMMAAMMSMGMGG